MKKGLRWKIILTAAVIAVSIFVAWPIQDKIKLGLDLKGGIHLVMQIMTEDAVVMETDQEILRLQDVFKKNTITFAAMTRLAPGQVHHPGAQPGRGRQGPRAARPVPPGLGLQLQRPGGHGLDEGPGHAAHEGPGRRAVRRDDPQPHRPVRRRRADHRTATAGSSSSSSCRASTTPSASSTSSRPRPSSSGSWSRPARPPTRRPSSRTSAARSPTTWRSSGATRSGGPRASSS